MDLAADLTSLHSGCAVDVMHALSCNYLPCGSSVRRHTRLAEQSTEVGVHLREWIFEPDLSDICRRRGRTRCAGGCCLLHLRWGLVCDCGGRSCSTQCSDGAIQFYWRPTMGEKFRVGRKWHLLWMVRCVMREQWSRHNTVTSPTPTP